MTLAKDSPTPVISPLPEAGDRVVFPPGDLYSDEPPLESELHLRQILLLIQCLEALWESRQDFYAFGNLTIYYSPNQRKSEFFREKHSEPFSVSVQEAAVQSIFGPDFFVVLGTERRPRKSWVVWEEEGKYPNVIIELLSDSTAKTDRGLKKEIYQDTFRTPDYFWFDPHNLALFHMEVEDLDYAPFDREGGLGSMYALFGEDMNSLLDEMNEALVA